MINPRFRQFRREAAPGIRTGKPHREAAPGSRAAAFPAVAATRNSDATGIFAAKFSVVGINQ
jgi:hypothetical protein